MGNFLCLIILLSVTLTFSCKPTRSPNQINPHDFHAKLYFNEGVQFEKCSGAVILNNYILTPAHCVKNALIVRMRLHGKTEKTTIDQANITIHELYDPTKALNDVALIRIAGDPALLNSLDLPNSTHVIDVVNKYYGWVSTPANTSSSVTSASLSSLSLTECQKVANNVTDQNLCTVPPIKKHLICNAESGGSLVEQDGTKGILLGLGSKVHKCLEGSVAVFIDIKSHLDWIRSKIV